MLDVRNLSVTDHKIVDDVGFQVKEKNINDCGPTAQESKIINAVSQGIPYTGATYLKGKIES